MPGYVYFTEEQKQRANQVDLEDFFSRQGEPAPSVRHMGYARMPCPEKGTW